MKTYLAGPITGVPYYNVHLFEAAAAFLRAKGLDVVSPIEMDGPGWRECALLVPDGDPAKWTGVSGHTWGDMLARDVKAVADECRQIALLPGWERSKGARLEAFVGLLCGHSFVGVYTDGENVPQLVSPYSRSGVLEDIFLAQYPATDA